MDMLTYHFFNGEAVIKNYTIFGESNSKNEGSVSWGMRDENGEEELPQLNDITTVLNCVIILFEKYFGKEYVESFQVSILPSIGYPVAYRKQNIIFLSAKGLRWSQYVYQFSHELCHMMITGNVPKHLRWFEETICELSSFFFLSLISEQWETNPPEHWRDYAPAFFKYKINVMKKAKELLQSETLSAYITKMLPALSEDPCKRDINALVANNLLPIFVKNPGLWKDVPNLGKIPEDITFSESLKTWKNLSANKIAVENIIDILIEQN